MESTVITRAEQATPSGVAADKQVGATQQGRVERIVVESAVPMLDTAMFDHMMRIAKIMSSSGLVPQHLNTNMDAGEALANCFLVTNQAVRWKMDPFAVAQHTFVYKGKLGYEGKLIAAVINTRPEIVERLQYEYSGAGDKRAVKVTAKIAGVTNPVSVEGTLAQWKTDNRKWQEMTDQMLAYRGAREWARRWLPEAILGVYGDDELQEFDRGATVSATTVIDQHPQRGAAGLKAAIVADTSTAAPAGNGEGATLAGAADAEPVAAATTDGDTQPKANPTKPAGTVEQRDAFCNAFSQCADTEVLGLKCDEANAFSWTKPDQDVITDAYRARLTALGG